ncbi:tRNA 2-methylthio-N6-isopentenyl adenosine(37) hydroxylase MiaE-like protein [Schaalia sp. ZJ405]|uniref:ferritin-like fold-containing protein n=1 Tax=unclassified Schaalia TaxID=2691889 RepID=UPI0013E9EAAF|nr:MULTISPECIES: ferritin-like fold-containing protein [unclassified Schaalia]QPK80849.1 tRNA 2-methylthio-N6-isopentenyl adenosine(37) hydroxylase MiaE-like protein [Schaalia sp. ZJ405]
MASQHNPLSGADTEVLGLVAYSALAVMTRLAKDGDQAPTIEAHVQNARMSAQAFSLFEQLEKWAQTHGVDLATAAGEFSGLYDDLDARTRPTAWVERLVKTYVTVGILGDMLSKIAEYHDLTQLGGKGWDVNQGEWTRNHLGPQTLEDEQLAARLSLWARRVAGEVFGLVRSTLFTHPNLLPDPDAQDELVQWITQQHRQRMTEISLKG